MRATVLGRVGLASALVFIVLVAAAHPEQDAELEARSALPQPSWKELVSWPFDGLSNVEEEDEIARPFLRTSTALEAVETTSTKHGEPNARPSTVESQV